MKKIINLLISCVLLLALVGCGDSSATSNKTSNTITKPSSTNNTTSSNSNTSSKTTLKSGQSVTLSDSTLVCSSKENLDKMLSFISQKNKDGQNEMLLNGQATILSKGTKVNVISTGITVEIEVNSKKWVAPYELIK